MALPPPMGTRRMAVAASAAVLLTGVLFGTPAAAGSGSATAADGSTSTGTAVSRTSDATPVDAAVRAYLTNYPGLTAAAARAAATTQPAREALYAALARDGGAAFGGAWFDPRSGVLHVAVTTAGARSGAVGAGRRLGLRVATHLVTRSLADLQKQAAALRAGAGVLGRAAAGNVGVDVENNRVLVAVPAAQRPALRGTADEAGVGLVPPGSARTELDVCSASRASCDDGLWAGSVISSGGAGCSSGFVGRRGDGARFVFTAGHCSVGNGAVWSTGGVTIGPMTASVNSGALDASIIQVTNPRFASATDTAIWDQRQVQHRAPLNGMTSAIVRGDAVCLSANFEDPAGSTFCGTIGTASDPAVRGMVRVDGYDACPGDSGGGWFSFSPSLRGRAYGLHSQSVEGCRTAGGSSWFSPMPTVFSGFTPNLVLENSPF